MSAETYSIGIAGFGNPSTGLPYRLRCASLLDVGGTVEPAAIVVGWPASLASQIHLEQSWVSQGTYKVKVACGYEETIGLDLLEWAFQSNPESVGWLTTDETDASVTWQVEYRAGFSLPSVPYNLYLGRECVLVTARVVVAGHTYDLTVVRGMYGTTASAHKSGKYSDRLLYHQNSIVEGREFVVRELDLVADTETERWRGFLERPDGISGDLLVAELSAKNIFAFLGQPKKKLGEGRLIVPGVLQDISETWNQGGITVHEQGAQWQGAEMVARDEAMFLADTAPAGTDARYLPMVWGETLIAADIWGPSYDTSDDEPYHYFVRQMADDGRAGYTSLHGTEKASGADAKTGMLREVLIADAGLDDELSYSLIRDDNGNRSDHPLDILRNIWCSTGTGQWIWGGAHIKGHNGDFDWLSRPWGMSIPDDFIDHDGIDDLKHGFYEGLRARNFVLGHDDKLSVKDVTRRLLQPLFAFPAITSEGKLTIRTLLDPGPGNTDATITFDDLARPIETQPWSEQPHYASVTMNAVRRGLSDSYGYQITDADLAGYVSHRYPFSRSTFTVDAGDYGHPHDHYITPEAHILLRMIGQFVHLVLSRRIPEYVLEVKPTCTYLPSGSFITLTYSALVGADGERGVSTHRCVVLQSERDEKTRTQKLHVIDLFPLTRAEKNVAPSWRIIGVTSQTVFVISASSFSDDDRILWEATETYRLLDRTGAERGQGGVGSSFIYATGQVTLGTAFDNGGPVLPVVGDIIAIDDYYAPMSGPWGEYAYIAETSALLDAQASAHKWGVS